MPCENGTTVDQPASKLRSSWGKRPSVQLIVTTDFEVACRWLEGAPENVRGVGVYRSDNLYFVPLEPKTPLSLYAEFEGLIAEYLLDDSTAIGQLPGYSSVLRDRTLNLDDDGDFQFENEWNTVDTPWPKLLVWFHEQHVDLVAGKDGDQSGSWKCLITLVADAIESLRSTTVANQQWNENAQQYRNMTLGELADCFGRIPHEPPPECSSDIDIYNEVEALRDLNVALCRRSDLEWFTPGDELTVDVIRGPLFDLLRRPGADTPEDLTIVEAVRILSPPRTQDNALDLILSWVIEEFRIKEGRKEKLPESPFLTTLRNQLVLLGTLSQGAPLSSTVLDVQCINLLCQHPRIVEPDDARKLKLSEASEVLAELTRIGNSQKNDAAIAGTSKGPPQVGQKETVSGRKRPGDGAELLKGHLREHHKWADGNPPDVGNIHATVPSKDLAKLLGISEGTVSAFFTKWFDGRKEYDSICERGQLADRGELAFDIKCMSGEMTPRELRKSLKDEAQRLSERDS